MLLDLIFLLPGEEIVNLGELLIPHKKRKAHFGDCFKKDWVCVKTNLCQSETSFKTTMSSEGQNFLLGSNFDSKLFSGCLEISLTLLMQF